MTSLRYNWIMPSNIKKIYLSNFLVGLVFWYGIEKLFMRDIGIDAVGVGIASALLLAFNLVFDIPSGILADRWSRKGLLFVASVALALSSLILGSSNNLAVFLVGYIFYGVYVVSTSGTFQALMYDSLHEGGLAKQYSKIMGRAYALFLVGAAVGNLASGFIASYTNFRTAFFISVIPCLVNMVVIASIKEPSFHKAEQKEKVVGQLRKAFGAITQITLLRGLAIIMTALAIVELFKSNFGQLYMLRYTSSAEVLGILWAGYALVWAFGSFIAHKMHARLHILTLATILPLVCMALVDSWFGLVFFMIQGVAAAALLNQIETRIQDATPSGVRASILSVLSSLGRVVSIPASIGLGWLINVYGIMWSVYAIALLGVMILAYWLWLKNRVSLDGTSAAS
jgi:predicted MFS family arabinose efflux permease